MTVDAVTARYTDAFFDLAVEGGKLDEVKADVELLGEAFSDPEVAAFLSNPRISREKKQRALAGFLEGLSPLTRNLVGLTLDRGREAVLVGLPAAFKKRLLARRGATEGVVESARPLEDAEIVRIAEAVGRELGKEVHLVNRVDPSLIGGVRVLCDFRLLDLSVRGRLYGLRRALSQVRVPAGSA